VDRTERRQEARGDADRDEHQRRRDAQARTDHSSGGDHREPGHDDDE
jgi:hypothetical protein